MTEEEKVRLIYDEAMRFYRKVSEFPIEWSWTKKTKQ